MLVVGRYLEYEYDVRYEAHCQWCGRIVGYLTRDELDAMVSGDYGRVECFGCVDFRDGLELPGQQWNWETSERVRALTLV